MELPSIDFSQLELREIGAWPRPIRIALIILSGILGSCLVFFLFLDKQINELNTIRMQQEVKRKEFKDKYTMAANLDAYKAQMVQIQDAYKIMLKQLPDSSNVPELIDSISRIAAADNLKFDSIKPGEPKSVSGFYKELPIDIQVVGGYHSFGKFVSDISKLSRIVTLHDFDIKADKGDGGNILSMKITAKTYWLSEETVPPVEQKGKTPAKGKASTSGTANRPSAAPSPNTPISPPPTSGPNRPTSPGQRPGGPAGPLGGEDI